MSACNSTTDLCDNLEEEPMCRLCLSHARPLVRVCKCSGTIRYLHQDCIGEWIRHKLMESLTNDPQSCKLPLCEICDEEYSASLITEEEQMSGDHFAEYYTSKEPSYRIYVLFLFLGMFVAVYFMLIGFYTWRILCREAFITMFCGHFVFPLWFIGHAMHVMNEDGKQINKLRKKQIYVELDPEEELE